jgi:RNA polymerase sigma factor (sigma-70 family)
MEHALHPAMAMEELKQKTFQTERGRLLRFIRSRISSLEEAEDILQDVFFQFVAGFDTIQSIEKVTSWLYAVARNKITDRYRRKSPYRVDLSSPQGASDEDGLMLQDILPSLGSSPEEVFLRESIWNGINEALDELPAEQKEIFVLNEIDGKSFREVAEATGTSINTLLSRKRYAILALRKKLQEMYDEL